MSGSDITSQHNGDLWQSEPRFSEQASVPADHLPMFEDSSQLQQLVCTPEDSVVWALPVPESGICIAGRSLHSAYSTVVWVVQLISIRQWCHSYFSHGLGWSVPGALAKRPGWFPWKEAESAHFPIRSMNSLIPDHRISFRYLLAWVRLYWMDSHHGPVTLSPQDFISPRVLFLKKEVLKFPASVPKDCGKLWDGKWCFFGYNWWWLVNMSLLPSFQLP